MRERLTEKEAIRLDEVKFTKADGYPVLTLADLLEALPDEVTVFRYRPEERWENMSDPTFTMPLEISKEGDNWNATYGLRFTNPDCRLNYYGKELIECLFNLAEAYATAPAVWIDKSNTVYRNLGESEEEYQQ